MDLGLEFDDVSPFLVGKRIGESADDAEKALVGKFLSAISDPDDPLATVGRMARQTGSDPDRIQSSVTSCSC